MHDFRHASCGRLTPLVRSDLECAGSSYLYNSLLRESRFIRTNTKHWKTRQKDRREFLKRTTASVTASLAGVPLGADQSSLAEAELTKLNWFTAPCRFCGVGCGVSVAVTGGRVVVTRLPRGRGQPRHELREGQIWKLSAGIIPDKPCYRTVLQNRMRRQSKVNVYRVMCNNNMQAAADITGEGMVVSDAYPAVHHALDPPTGLSAMEHLQLPILTSSPFGQKTYHVSG